MAQWLPPCLCRVTGRWVSASQGKGCSIHSPPNPGLGSYPRASSGTRCPSRTECVLLAFLCLAVAPELSSARKGQRTSCMPPTPVLLRAPSFLLRVLCLQGNLQCTPQEHHPQGGQTWFLPLQTGDAEGSGQDTPCQDRASTAEGTGALSSHQLPPHLWSLRWGCG